MNKTEYMNTLRQELDGLPADVLEDTMWAYEGRFVDGMVAGRDESAIADSLPAPHIVAAQKRASVRYQELKKNSSPGNLASLLVALLGVLAFNFLMIIPAIAYSSLLFAAYLSSLVFYFVGIVVTATALSGVPQINLHLPTHHTQGIDGVITQDIPSRHHGNVRVDITPRGITVNDENEVELANDAPESAAASATESNTASTAAPGVATPAGKTATGDAAVHVSIDNHLSKIHLLNGLGFLLAGIALFMLSLFMTKYTFIGFKKYLRWNLSLLRPAAAA